MPILAVIALSLYIHDFIHDRMYIDPNRVILYGRRSKPQKEATIEDAGDA